MTTSLQGLRVALVGGAGFVGHHLARTLASRGALPHVIDSLQVNNLLAYAAANSEVPHRESYLKFLNDRLDALRSAGIPLYPIDARDYHILSRVLTTIRPQAIIHLAAISHAGRSNKDPYSTFDHSLRTLENALDFARQGTAHFLFFSSSMAYGNFLTEAVDEEHPLNPIGIYGALKVGGEKLVIAYQQVFDLPYTIIRPSALYGPRCVSRRVLQIFLESALSGQPLRIEGDGSERLDFTHIDDLVEGICLALQRPEAKNQIFNMTYGKSCSVAEAAEILKKEFPGIRVETGARDRLMPIRGTLKIDKAARLLGYQPQNPLQVGLPKYARWYREESGFGGGTRGRA